MKTTSQVSCGTFATKFALALALALLSFLPNALAQASSSASTLFMTLEGVKSGQIKGESTLKGREDQHKVLAYSHEIVSLRDPQSGLPTGKRQHQPFRVVKLINSASPVLLNLMATSELFKTVTIDVWTPNSVGVDNKILTYKLTNASLISLRPWMPNKSDSSAAGYPPAEELAFVYQTITVTYWNGGVTGQDDWN